MNSIFTRVIRFYQAKGIASLLAGISAHLHIYSCSTYYVYKTRYPKDNLLFSPPKINNLAFEIPTTTAQLEDLLNRGYDFGSNIRDAKRKLKNGAVGFLIFVNKELAATYWTALNEKAKRTIDPQPYRVDFANHEACDGGAWTNPKYRRLGLNSYLNQKLSQYYNEKGIKSTRGIILVSNVASLTAHEKNHPDDHTPRAIGRYLVLCGIPFWKEKPATVTDYSKSQGKKWGN